MENNSLEWVILAQVKRPQGRVGEVLCELFTDFPERFAERKRLHLRKLSDERPAPYRLDNFWLPTGKSLGRVVLKFQGVDTIADAEALTGSDVLIEKSERVSLDSGTFYVDDLQGCTVVNLAGGDGPDQIGTITGVHFPTDSKGRRMEHAPSILIVTRDSGDEVLIPLANEFLKNPDLVNRRIEVALPAGLVEANG